MKIICIKNSVKNKLIIVDDSLDFNFVHRYCVKNYGSSFIFFKSDKINWNEDEFKLFLLGSNFTILYFHEKVLPIDFIIQYKNITAEYHYSIKLNKENIIEFYNILNELIILWNKSDYILDYYKQSLDYLNENKLEIDKIINEQIIKEIV